MREGAARKPLLFHFVLFFVPFRIPPPSLFLQPRGQAPPQDCRVSTAAVAERRRSHHALHTSPPPRSRRSKSQWATRTAAGAFRRPSHRPPIVRHLLRKPVNQASSHAGLANCPRGRGPARQPPGARGTPLPNNTNAGVFAP